MTREQMNVYAHLLIRPPLTAEGERCHCCQQHTAFWHGADNPNARVSDFYKPRSLASGAFQAGQDWKRHHQTKLIRKKTHI